MNKRTLFTSTLIVLLMLLTVQRGFGFQIKREIPLSQVYKSIIQSKDTSLVLSNFRIYDDIDYFSYEIDSKAYLELLEDRVGFEIPMNEGKIISNVKELVFSDVQGDHLLLQYLDLEQITLTDLSLEYLSLRNLNANAFIMDSVVVFDEYRLDSLTVHSYQEQRNQFQSYQIYDSEFTGHFMTTQSEISGLFWIYGSRFGEGAYIGPTFTGKFNDMTLEGNVFEPIDSNVPVALEEFKNDSAVYRTQLYLNLFGELYQVNLAENDFLNKGNEQFVFVEGEFDYLGIEGNLFESHFYPQTAVDKQLALSDNNFEGKVIFSELILGGQNNAISWSDISGNKMAVGVILDYTLVDDVSNRAIPEELKAQLFEQTQNMVIEIFEGNQKSDYEEKELFQSLISSYYRLYTNIKDNGQIQNADSVYVEMKDVQLKQFAYLYETYGSMDYWIQWRLNQLLKVYTDHGTNPTKAIRISIWVICIFSVFYFFFPSEWDTKSKTQLIEDYKLFIKKNDHGYFEPFMKLSYGFSKSLLNAFTLSLNSFVTLGFGTIPTSGGARYICILQGFIGWFLLSIFTASLINQVLF